MERKILIIYQLVSGFISVLSSDAKQCQ